MAKVFKIIGIITVVMVVLIIGIVALAFIATGNQTKATEINLGTDTIDTLFTVVGERKVTEVSFETTSAYSEKVVKYDAGVVSIDDLDQYVIALQTKGYLITEEFDGSKIQIGFESNEEGKILLINIVYSETGSTVITYMKGEGTLTRY